MIFLNLLRIALVKPRFPFQNHQSSTTSISLAKLMSPLFLILLYSWGFSTELKFITIFLSYFVSNQIFLVFDNFYFSFFTLSLLSYSYCLSFFRTSRSSSFSLYFLSIFVLFLNFFQCNWSLVSLMSFFLLSFFVTPKFPCFPSLTGSLMPPHL